jgi:hypothetical protein
MRMAGHPFKPSSIARRQRAMHSFVYYAFDVLRVGAGWSRLRASWQGVIAGSQKVMLKTPSVITTEPVAPLMTSGTSVAENVPAALVFVNVVMVTVPVPDWGCACHSGHPLALQTLPQMMYESAPYQERCPPIW